MTRSVWSASTLLALLRAGESGEKLAKAKRGEVQSVKSAMSELVQDKTYGRAPDWTECGHVLDERPARARGFQNWSPRHCPRAIASIAR